MVVGVSVGRKTRLGDRVGVQLSHFTCVGTIECGVLMVVAKVAVASLVAMMWLAEEYIGVGA